MESVESALIDSDERGRRARGVSGLDALQDPNWGGWLDKSTTFVTNYSDQLLGGGFKPLQRALWGDWVERYHNGPGAESGRLAGQVHALLLTRGRGAPVWFQRARQVGGAIGAADRAEKLFRAGDYVGAAVALVGGVGQFDPQAAQAANIVGNLHQANQAVNRGDWAGAAFRAADAGGVLLDRMNPCDQPSGASDLLRAWHLARTGQRVWEGAGAARRGDWAGALGSASSAWASWGQFTQPCFAAGTPVRTPDGAKPVEEVAAGDRVLSRDEHDPSGPVLAKVVEAVFVRQAPVLEVGAGGRVVRTTREHPFYAEGKGWVAAAALEVGDRLWTETGDWVAVESLTVGEGEETVYNFRVADFHTYFVGCLEWGFALWTHNTYAGAYPANPPAGTTIGDNFAAVPQLPYLLRVPALVHRPSSRFHLAPDRRNQFLVDDNEARRILDRNLGGITDDHHDAHHLLPWEGRLLPGTSNAYELAAMAGWNINGAENGILLPDNYHENNHRVYSRRVLDRIESAWMNHGNQLDQHEWSELFHEYGRDAARGIIDHYDGGGKRLP